jgi:transposase
MTKADSDRKHHPSILSQISADFLYISIGFTDMRLSIDGLAAKVQQVFQLDPCASSLFLFCGRRNDRIKALYFEGDGFLLMYKRLESKGRFQWPRLESEARLITPQQLRWLLEGLSIEQPKALRNNGSLIVV